MNIRRITTLLLLFFVTCQLSAQVKAFRQSDFGGKAIELKPGKYAHAQLVNRGLGTLAGLRVPKGCRVKVYAADNQQGDAKIYSENTIAVNQSGDYSLKVNCGSVGAVPGFAIGASDEVGRKGDLVFVDVNVSDFENIVSMQYSMNWNPEVLQFEKVQNLKLKDLTLENFGLKETGQGNLLFAWYDQSVQGVTMPDGTNIYQVVFRVVGESGASGKIKFSSKPIVQEVMLPDGTPVFFNHLDGSIKVR